MSHHTEMKPLVKAELFRDAAAVKRYHAKRVLREQSVGAHSFNMMLLVQQVMPNCRKEVLLAVMHHDLPELVTGDIPAPIKRAHPMLGPLMDEIEQDLAPLYHDFKLFEDEAAVVKWADRMELVLWCLEEYRMGNTYTKDTIRRGMGWIMAAPYPSQAIRDFTFEVWVECTEKHGLDPATGAELEMKK